MLKLAHEGDKARRSARLLAEALAELVRLKDGPRDDAYRRDKPKAWEAARAALDAYGRAVPGEENG